MKKLWNFFGSIYFVMLIALLSFAPASSASVGLEIGGTYKGEATTLNLSGPEDLTFDGSKITIPVVDKDLYAAGVADGGSTSMTTYDETIPIAYSHILKAISSDSTYDDGVLPDGEPGQLLTLQITERFGSGTFIVTPATATGWATVTFDAAGEFCTWWYVDDTQGWVVFGYTNATLVQP